MGFEQHYIRTPLAKMINATSDWTWIPSRNVISATGISSVLPGQPDAHAHRRGGSGIIYFETKSTGRNAMTSIDMTEWDRQRNWWDKNCRQQEVPYWIVLGVYAEKIERLDEIAWPQWRWFAVTPEMWLAVKAYLPEGQNSLPLNPLTAKKSRLPITLTVEGEWADYCLWYQSGKLILPPEHPLTVQLGENA